MIQARHLSKKYEDGALALDDLNLDVNPGEIYCLLGANGAGKSTTINLFLGYIQPSSGQALVNGIDASRDPLEAKRHLSYVPEKVALYPALSARQNLDLFCRLRGKPATRDEYVRVFERLGLPEKAFEQPVQKFSKGMHQKIGLAILLLSDAPALLLDEPMSGLDPKSCADWVEMLLELRGQGKAILMSTHDIFRAKSIADRVGILRGGKKILEKTAIELRHQDLERLYLEHIGGSSPAEQPKTVEA